MDDKLLKGAIYGIFLSALLQVAADIIRMAL